MREHAVKGLDRSTPVWQAMGIISTGTDCTLEEAESKLRDRAAVEGQFVEDMARAVVARTVSFGR